MTESEWLACGDPQMMLEFLRGKASDRKLRLFAVACCHRIWPMLTDGRSRSAVALAERSADQDISPEILDAASGEAEEAFEDAITDNGDTEAMAAACSAASYASNPVLRASDVLEVLQATADAASGTRDERLAQCRLLRCIFGKPSRPVTIDPACLSSNVVALARTIYEERAFHSMPELANALEAAGCHDADILGHCHQAGPHVRGCWVVDAVLGKS